MENIFIERLWRSVKYEEICLKDYTTTEVLRKALRKYCHFYNNERPYQTFDGATPVEMYRQSIDNEMNEINQQDQDKVCALTGDSGCVGSAQAKTCG